MKRDLIRLLMMTGSALALSWQAHAQTAAQNQGTVPDEQGIVTSPELVVTAPYVRERTDILSGISVVSGEELTRDIRPQIGDILAHQPGVSATSFGPGASRPVLRGFQGERVRVLTDGIGAFDVSNTSADHAVVINPLTAERIEVLHGPTTLLYGSSAIGGVVNIIDRRIPRRAVHEAAHVDALADYGSAAGERNVGGSIDLGIGSRLIAHADGSYLESDDLRTGGHLLSPTLRAEAEAAGSDAGEVRGRLPNTAVRTWDLAGGLAIIAEGSNLGISVSHFDTLYGVPSRPSFNGGESETVQIDMHQTRVDARTEIDLGDSLFETLRGRFGWADYQHTELANGEPGTRFFNQGLEGRLELVQAKRGVWRGAVGGQIFIRDFRSEGEEAFIPPNETTQVGLFTLQEFDLGMVKAEAAARYEHTNVNSNTIGIERRFDTLSFSAGASMALNEDWRIGINGSRTVRAPSAEEMFANGPHAGTQAFEIGDTELRTEKSWGAELVLRGGGDGYHLDASAYASWFTDYIYQEQTGAIEDELPVFQYRQADARYYGFEIEGSLRLAEVGQWSIVADALTDYVHATIKDVGPAPRIPPLRLLGGIEAQSDRLDGRIEAEWVDRQARTANFETPTDGYTVVNASLAWRPFGRDSGASVILSANNIFDVVARRHASFLKDFAPLAGRDIRLSLRANF